MTVRDQAVRKHGSAISVATGESKNLAEPVDFAPVRSTNYVEANFKWSAENQSRNYSLEG